MWGEVKNNIFTTCQKEAMGHRDKTKKSVEKIYRNQQEFKDEMSAKGLCVQ